MLCWFVATSLAPAWGQDAGPAEGGSPEALFVDPGLPLTYAKGWWWVSTGPRLVDDITDLAIHPDRDDVWAVVDGDGAVWVTYDGGQIWIDVFRPLETSLSADEDLLREAEARIGELTDTIEAPSGDEFVDEDALSELENQVAEAEDAAQDAINQLQSELEGDRWFLDDRLAIGFRPRVAFTPGGLLLVARSDGLHLSTDLGASWSTVLSEPVTAFSGLRDHGWAVGTPTGLKTTLDLVNWVDEPAFDGVGVRDLVADGGLYVATEQGLWWTEDLAGWLPLAAWKDDAYTVRPLIEPEPPLWLGGPRGLVVGAIDDLWVAESPLESPAFPSQGGPVRAARDIVRRDVAMLVAASASGPWESTDGGVTWVRIDRGLEATDCRAVEIRGEIVLLAAGNGLQRLRPLPPGSDVEASPLEPWVPLPILVEASLTRPELSQKLGSRWVAAALPQVALAYTRRDEEELHWDAATWTTLELQDYWLATVTLTWRPNRQRTGTAFDAETGADTVNVFVVNDDLVVDDGTSPTVMYSKVSRGATAYRDDLTETISRLYLSRQRLVQERALVRDEALMLRVQRQLRISELEARLDVLTDGAVSAWDPGEPE